MSILYENLPLSANGLGGAREGLSLRHARKEGRGVVSPQGAAAVIGGGGWGLLGGGGGLNGCGKAFRYLRVGELAAKPESPGTRRLRRGRKAPRPQGGNLLAYVSGGVH